MRKAETQRQPWQFSLGDLFLLALVVAILCAPLTYEWPLVIWPASAIVWAGLEATSRFRASNFGFFFWLAAGAWILGKSALAV